MTWWSPARCRAALAPPASPDATQPAEPLELLVALTESLEGSAPAARDLLAALGQGSGRDVWISWAPLGPSERTLLAAAVLGDWAVLRDPAAALHPATFAWARPTLASGDRAALAALARGLEEMAPRWRRERWLRGRLGRLRAWIVTGDSPADELATHLRKLAPQARLVGLAAAGGPQGPPEPGFG